MLDLADFRAAATRIAGSVRRTPLIAVEPVKTPLADVPVTLKLESLQVTGSFKARGAMNKLRQLSEAEIGRGLVTASGGNHGLAIAYAGWLSGKPATVFVPEGVSAEKRARIAAWGATVIVSGGVWDETNLAALAFGAENGATYVHPFADPAVIAGQGTVALELLEQDPDIDTLVVAIGGGGLISGIAAAAKALKPGIRIFGVEPVGAPTLHASLAAGRVVKLDAVTTRVPTLAARQTEEINFEIVRRHVETIVLVSDDDMQAASVWLWREMGIAAELSGAAAVAALLTGRIPTAGSKRLCALVCGTGADGIG